MKSSSLTVLIITHWIVVALMVLTLPISFALRPPIQCEVLKYYIVGMVVIMLQWLVLGGKCILTVLQNKMEKKESYEPFHNWSRAPEPIGSLVTWGPYLMLGGALYTYMRRCKALKQHA